jgi:CheY-like chemotaxis protein
MTAEAQKRILIIEDDAPIRDSICELLEDEGYLVEAAANGQEALDMLRSLPAAPDLILLDLMMPVKDGFQFREEQRQDPALADIPIVIMSADGNVQRKVKQVGALSYLKKPVDIDAVLEAVKRHT